VKSARHRFRLWIASAQALEVAFGVGLKTIANYANKIAATPLDGGFAKVAWTKAA
jgi:hypothetical protein